MPRCASCTKCGWRSSARRRAAKTFQVWRGDVLGAYWASLPPAPLLATAPPSVRCGPAGCLQVQRVWWCHRRRRVPVGCARPCSKRVGPPASWVLSRVRVGRPPRCRHGGGKGGGTEAQGSGEGGRQGQEVQVLSRNSREQPSQGVASAGQPAVSVPCVYAAPCYANCGSRKTCPELVAEEHRLYKPAGMGQCGSKWAAALK